MKTVNVHEAKTRLSELLKKVEAGEEILITRAGKPVARLTPTGTRAARTFGTARGRFTVPEDFDDPLPEALLREFYT